MTTPVTPGFTQWNGYHADYLQKSYVGNMIRYAPNGQAPIFALTSLLNSDGRTLSKEHGYFSKTMIFPSLTANGAVNSSATTITVDATSKVIPGDMMRNQSTGEIIRVLTVPSATSVTVTRGVGQIAAAAIADNAVLYGIGNVFEESSKRPQSRTIDPVRVVNNTQIFRNAWALSGSMNEIAAIVGETPTAESRADAGLLHAADIEKAMLFGQLSGSTVNGQYMTTMDGIVETVRRLAPAANTSTAGATTNFTQLEAMLNPCFNTINNGRNGNERTIFVGGSARTVINNIGRLSGSYQIVDGQTNFGLSFQTFRTTRGVFRMIEHPILNSNTAWSRMAIALDLPAIRTRYLGARRQVNKEYGFDSTPVQDGLDSVGGDLLSELTMENINPSAHAVVHGLTAGAAG